jgi:hypothetical protein
MTMIHFATKEENNRRRQEEFLALSPGERFELFLKLCAAMSHFPQDRPVEDKGNFIVDKLRKDHQP